MTSAERGLLLAVADLMLELLSAEPSPLINDHWEHDGRFMTTEIQLRELAQEVRR